MLRRFGNKIKKKFKTAINGKPNLPGSPEFVRDSILEHGKKITEGSAYYWGNATKNGQNGVKGLLWFMVLRDPARMVLKLPKTLVEAIRCVALYVPLQLVVKWLRW